MLSIIKLPLHELTLLAKEKLALLYSTHDAGLNACCHNLMPLPWYKTAVIHM
jgi:hypothetical protein